MKNIKQYIVGIVLVVGVFGYAFLSRQNSQATAVSVGDLSNATSSAVVSVSNTSNGQYKDGTYTGSVADAFYGNLQVQAIVKGGQMSDITFLQYPNDNSNSANLSNASLPILKKEAIAAQSSQVNIVSGATQVSQAFQSSLASALAQAKA